MTDRKGRSRTAGRAALAVLAFAVGAGLPAPSTAADSLRTAQMPIDPAVGRELFVEKGCVICHSVNGVGGMAGPPLDLPPEGRNIDVAEFAANMWRGAGPMVWLQTLELGYQIDLTGADIADLAGFVHDPAERARFTLDQIAEPLRDAFLTEPYVRPEDWEWETEPE
ncbi:MAG: c-type cytochrome [Inquilinus sp.]|nr:c-type cytochrome [Inquilinus sp.]